ncbi:DUF4136 domain-containing protein [Telluribacter humicola]|uniref:DUF4136 domain-containing protein n=1 Tax=Telluribacter humicola TaxID=1720261 RepID=UPI001A9643C3|nr:DUF4136 domain-containing protein [Telluribacter humicola]
MRGVTTYIFALISMLAVASCSPRVRVVDAHKAQELNAAQYPTFGFGEINIEGDSLPLPGQVRLNNSINMMKDAIARNLRSKGMQQSLDPALKINISLAVDEKIQTRQTNFANDGAPRYVGQYRWRWQVEEKEVGRYDMGRLSLEMVDADDNSVVLKSVAEGVLPKKMEKLEYTIEEAVQRMIAQSDK